MPFHTPRACAKDGHVRTCRRKAVWRPLQAFHGLPREGAEVGDASAELSTAPEARLAAKLGAWRRLGGVWTQRRAADKPSSTVTSSVEST